MTKPIVCPECILSFERTQSEKSDSQDDEQERSELNESNTVKSFNNWKAYAYHILKEHPSSARVGWVISCINEEQNKCKQDDKEIPKSTKILLDLIDNPVEQIIATEEIIDEQPILTDDKDWKDRLADLHGLSLEKEELDAVVPIKKTSRLPDFLNNKHAKVSSKPQITLKQAIEPLQQIKPTEEIEAQVAPAPKKSKGKNPISQFLYNIFAKPL